MNISDISDQMCYGCGVCSIACSGGVSLDLDKDGYYKSHINNQKCIDCGRCISICPVNGTADEINSPAYAACALDYRDAFDSASGGLAHIIAKEYLHKGFSIVGAVWSEDFKRVEHIVVKDETDLDRLRKSKYVQSYTTEAFSQIKYLEKVVVFGTPCQIAGLRNLFGNKTDMILIDFDCMGPAGLQLWSKYHDYLMRTNSSGIASLQQRHKKRSWLCYGTEVKFKNGKEYFKDLYHDPFDILYHQAHMIQKACVMDCKYMNCSKADLRIGDAWNYLDGFTKKQIRNGLSIVTPITDRGNDVFNEIRYMISAKEVLRVSNKRISMNSNERLWECIRDPGETIEEALTVYDSVGFIRNMLRRISYLVSSNDTTYLAIKRIQKAVNLK